MVWRNVRAVTTPMPGTVINRPILLHEAAHLVLEITADADQAGSRHEQRTDDLALRALHAYFPIPANAVRR
jgi:hypothetical protein